MAIHNILEVKLKDDLWHSLISMSKSWPVLGRLRAFNDSHQESHGKVRDVFSTGTAPGDAGDRPSARCESELAFFRCGGARI